jgi:hypothetical protein
VTDLGDLATWVGSIGTWAVGVLAAFIAWSQYRNGIFKPDAKVYVAPDARTVAVRIVNLGGAAGMVDRVDIINDHDGPLMDIDWGDDWRAHPPVPFILPGKASAILVLKTATDVRTQSRLEVVYGDASSSGCLELVETDGSLAEQTILPSGGLGIRRPPLETP